VVPPTEGDEREVSIDAHVLGDISGTTPIAALQARQRARVAGRVRSLTVQPWGDVPTLQVQLTDDHGRLTVAFLGRRQIAGLVPGSRIVVDGTVTDRRGQLVMINPDYQFVATGELA
jgi:RecG-like helicase